MTGTILVTGAGGFVGGHVCIALRARGYAVRALDVSWPPQGPPADERLTASVLDEAAWRKAAEGCAAIIHAAAIAHLWTRDPADFERVNVQGTIRAAQAARAAGARLVHVSSYTTLISGPDTPPRTLDETAEVAPEHLLGPYPASKRRAELAVMDAVSRGLDGVIVLPSSPVGPGDHRLTAPTKMLLDLAQARLPAFLDCRLDLVDVRALAAGIVDALEQGASGTRYLLTGESLAFSEIAARVEAETGAPAPRARAPYRLAWAAAFLESGWARLSGRAPNAPLTGVRLAGRQVSFSYARASKAFGYAPPPASGAIRDALAWMAETGLRPATQPQG